MGSSPVDAPRRVARTPALVAAVVLCGAALGWTTAAAQRQPGVDCPTADGLGLLADDLAQRAAQLDQRALTLAAREAQLDQTEAQVTALVERAAGIRDQAQAASARLRAVDDAQLAHLQATVAAGRPEQVAGWFVALEPALGRALFTQMPPAQAARLLGALPPDHAASLVGALAGPVDDTSSRGDR